MKPLIVLSLIFLSGCGILHIEIRDKTPAKTTTKRQEEAPKPSQEKPASLRVPMPVKGKTTPTEKGYYITTSCNEFFRSVSDGKVLYAGDDIKNYRWVVMVESNEGLVYVYAMADSLLVKKGEGVKRGQPLGKVGKNKEVCGLLFEIRDREGRSISFEFML